MVADLKIFYQNGLISNLLLVPKVVLHSVWSAADLATRMPIHQSWVNPTILYL